MLKKLVPVALVGLLAGCAAYQEALSIKESLQTFLVRSVTMKAPGGGETCKVILIWGGTTALTSLKRDGADVNIDKTKNYGEDQVTANGTTYHYTALFDNQKSILRDIQPFTTGDAGDGQAVDPKSNDLAVIGAGGPIVPRTGLKFRWKMQAAGSTPSGFLLTVGEISDPLQPAGVTPIYNAFLNAASHSVGVNTYEAAFGAPSDLTLLTKEISDLMGNMDPRFAKKDSGVTSDQLDPAKKYAWIVSPLKIDDKAIRFAVGGLDAAPFRVSQ